MGEPAHGRHTVLTVDADDISAWTKTSSLEINPDVHDVTGYGLEDKRKTGGMRDNSFTASGFFDSDQTSGPGGVLGGRQGETVELTRRMLGTGAGKPEQTFTAVIGKYTETSPADDIVTWSCDFAISGPVVSTVQSAGQLLEQQQGEQQQAVAR